MTDGVPLEQLRLYLPQWLSPQRQTDLWNELRSFPANRTIFSSRIAEPEILQGDGWRGFIAIEFHTVERKLVSGLVLSNSCDISPANQRVLTTNITFVPLVKLRRYLEVLERAGQTPEQRQSIAETIRAQRMTAMMHIPAVPDVMEESVAIFADVRSQPLDHFLAGERSLLFRLSDFGFYLFLFKLSIHFTRMLNDVER
jgi:hypothetical protein